MSSHICNKCGAFYEMHPCTEETANYVVKDLLGSLKRVTEERDEAHRALESSAKYEMTLHDKIAILKLELETCRKTLETYFFHKVNKV